MSTSPRSLCGSVTFLGFQSCPDVFGSPRVDPAVVGASAYRPLCADVSGGHEVGGGGAGIAGPACTLDTTFPTELRGLTGPHPAVFFPTIERRAAAGGSGHG